MRWWEYDSIYKDGEEEVEERAGSRGSGCDDDDATREFFTTDPGPNRQERS